MKIIFRMHAVERMFERNITIDDIKDVINNGKIIEEYQDDKPYPSKLLLKFVGGRPLHAVIAENKVEDQIIVITVYEPDENKWSENFERRK